MIWRFAKKLLPCIRKLSSNVQSAFTDTSMLVGRSESRGDGLDRLSGADDRTSGRCSRQESSQEEGVVKIFDVEFVKRFAYRKILLFIKL